MFMYAFIDIAGHVLHYIYGQLRQIGFLNYLTVYLLK